MVVPISLLKLGVKVVTASLPSASGPRGFKINVETEIKAAAAQLKRVGEVRQVKATGVIHRRRKLHGQSLPVL